MASTKSVKQRIRSVKNIAQITKAMEVVSATKMRKSQEFALRARPYAFASLEMLRNLLSRTRIIPPLLCARPIQTSTLLVITSDKGLAAALNANVLKRAMVWIIEKEKSKKPYRLILVGKKAKDFFERRNKPISKSFARFGDYRTPQETLPVADYIIEGFTWGNWDEVDAVYTNFRTTLLQEVALRHILPATETGLQEMVKGIIYERGRYSESPDTKYQISDKKYNHEYKFEPSVEEVLNVLVLQLIRMHIHHLILESNASEHSARMVAMKNASDNAVELITDLSLTYNKARQAAITNEIMEITSGQEALEKV